MNQQCFDDKWLFLKVLLLLLTDISVSLKILDNINVIISTEKYDTDTSLSFHIVQTFGEAKVFVRLITK